MSKLTAANFQDCLARIAGKGGVNAKEAEKILEDVNREADLFGDPASPERYLEAAQGIADQVKELAALDQLDALRNAAIRTRIMKQITDAGGLANAPTTLRSLMHGTNIGARDSIEAQWRGVAAGWQGALSAKLHGMGLEKVAISGEIDRDIARELWTINTGEDMRVHTG